MLMLCVVSTTIWNDLALYLQKSIFFIKFAILLKYREVFGKIVIKYFVMI